MSELKQLIFQTSIAEKIFTLRGKKVMLDRDIAKLYEVRNNQLKNAALVRNPDRFPPDFMFQLTEPEIEDLIKQGIIPSKSHLGGATPLAFTHSGVGMLSAVLNSKKAIQVSIEIMRTFERLSKKYYEDQKLNEEVESIKKRVNSHDNQIGIIIDTLGQMALDEQEKENKKPIGFISDVEKVDPKEPLFPDEK